MKRHIPTTLHAKPKKVKLSKHQKAAKSKLYDDAIDSACSQQPDLNSTANTTLIATDEATDASLNSLSNQMIDLLKLVDIQSQIIKSLDNKVNILLSFLGLTKNNISQSALHDIDLTNDAPTQSISQKQSTADNHSQSDKSLPQVRANPVPTSYSQAASLKGAIRQTVLSTVYVNQIIKEKRANSIVIKGLDTVDDSSLQDAAHHLLSRELQIEPNIKYCKRLGRPTPARIQPLLVVLSSVDEANSILSVAKNMRQSSNPYVSQCVTDPTSLHLKHKLNMR